MNSHNESTTESPITVGMFLQFLNANGRTTSREWLYRQFKLGTLPSLRINKKILLIQSQVIEAMKTQAAVEVQKQSAKK